MTPATLAAAIAEAERFLARARALQALPGNTYPCWYGSPRKRGAVRRASMELTRALADLRRAA